MMGNIIAVAIILALAFFSGRSTLRAIRAEMRGEGTCAGCSGGCGRSGEACCSCMKQMEELRKLKESKENVTDCPKNIHLQR